LNTLKIINGNFLQEDSGKANEFEHLYILLRKKEGRIFSDGEIARLPDVSSSHPHHEEWKIRKRSCGKLVRYVQENRHLCNMLEVGCGNGWLSAQLAEHMTDSVVGIDINRLELKQAQKVFKNKRNLSFVEGDIRSGILQDEKFDLIVFAASVQYFNPLKEIIRASIRHLTLQGEIHIIDSYFYEPEEIAAAQKRSKKYFSDMGYPAMSRFYYHHGLRDLKPFNYSVLYDPYTRFHQWFQKNPFHWIVIRNHYS
jgi:ubiquinone/menaquinone biosynthesis C-methylase UbiE